MTYTKMLQWFGGDAVHAVEGNMSKKKEKKRLSHCPCNAECDAELTKEKNFRCWHVGKINYAFHPNDGKGGKGERFTPNVIRIYFKFKRRLRPWLRLNVPRIKNNPIYRKKGSENKGKRNEDVLKPCFTDHLILTGVRYNPASAPLDGGIKNGGKGSKSFLKKKKTWLLKQQEPFLMT